MPSNNGCVVFQRSAIDHYEGSCSKHGSNRKVRSERRKKRHSPRIDLSSVTVVKDLSPNISSILSVHTFEAPKANDVTKIINIVCKAFAILSNQFHPYIVKYRQYLLNMIDMFLCTGKYDDIDQIDKGKLPLDFRQQDAHCSMIPLLRIIQSERHASKTEKTVMGCKAGFISIFSGNFDLPISDSVFNVENISASPSESIYSSMCGIWWEFQILTAFKLR